jgi:hypothetical protein
MFFSTTIQISFENNDSNYKINNISNSLTDWVPTGSNGKTILFDEHHGGVYAQYAPGHVSMLGGYLLQAGYSVNSNIDQNLTSQLLENVDILVISFPEFSYSTNEISVIHDFIQNGKSAIFLATARSNPEKMDTTNLNPITESMGVTFEASFVNIQNSIKIINTTHPVGIGVSGIYVVDSAPMILDNSYPLTVIAKTFDETNSVIVAGTYGNGKVLFLASRSLFQNFIDTQSPGEFKFVINTFDWLSGTISKIDTTKSSAAMPIPIRMTENISEGILKRYQLIFGNTHIHSSEGSTDSGAPVASQLQRILDLGYDFATLTDHDSDSPMDSWEPALKFLKDNNITSDDLNLILGIEGSADGGHYITIPIIKQEHNDDAYKNVETYHKQNALVFWAHPLLSYSNDVHMVFENFDEIGLDGFEIVNSGHFGDEEGGIGEFGLNHPFIGSSDAHSQNPLKRTENYIFSVDSSTDSLKDSILSRRNVVYARYNSEGDTVDFFTGDTDWLNEFYRRNQTANSALQNYQNLLVSLESSSFDLSQAKNYFDKAVLNRDLRNIHRVVDNIELGMQSLYPTTINILESNIKTGSTVTIKVSLIDQNQNTVSDASIDFKLFDGMGNFVNETTKIVDQTEIEQKISIPFNIDEGEFFLWSNISIKGAFFENKLFFNVSKGTQTTSSVNNSTTTDNSQKANFPDIFILGTTFICLLILKRKENIKNRK